MNTQNECTLSLSLSTSERETYHLRVGNNDDVVVIVGGEVRRKINAHLVGTISYYVGSG